MPKSKTVYAIDEGDVQSIAIQELSRSLTAEELKYVIDNLPGYIDWQQVTSMVIDEAVHFPSKTSQQP